MAVLRQKNDVDLMLSYAENDPWHWLAMIAELAPSAAMDPLLRERLRQALRRWIARAGSVYVRPTDRQCAMFRHPDHRAHLFGLLADDRFNSTMLAYELDGLVQT
jgi:hypothetical protein